MLNLAIVVGTLTKPTQVRALPSGLSLACFDLQVVRDDQAMDTVPVAFFDAPAEVAEWRASQELLAVGRVRRRFFRIGGVTQSRTELVAERVVPFSAQDRVVGVLSTAGAAIARLLDEIGARAR